MTERNAAHWDARYRAAQRAGAAVWSHEANRFVTAELSDLPPGTGVDLGAGEGRHSLWLASRGWRMTAVDFSAVGLDAGARRAADLGLEVSWVAADVLAWEPDGAVDLVLMAYLHLASADVAALTARAAGWLRDGGTLLLVGHDLENLGTGAGGPTDPDHLYHGGMVLPGVHVLRNTLRERAGADGIAARDRVIRAVRSAGG